MSGADLPPTVASPAADLEIRPRAVVADAHEDVVVPLAAEEVVVSRQTRQTTVRVSTRTVERAEHVDVPLTHRRVEIERVSINQVVAAMPVTREVDGVTIVPVVEEVVVVERRLVLKEEIHIRPVIVEDRHMEDVVLRHEEVDVTRTETGHEPGDPVASGIPNLFSKETKP